VYRAYHQWKTDQYSATADFEKSTAECLKLFGYRRVEDEINVGIDKFVSKNAVARSGARELVFNRGVNVNIKFYHVT